MPRSCLDCRSGIETSYESQGDSTSISQHHQSHASTRHRCPFGATRKKICCCISASDMPSLVDILAFGKDLKKRATARRNSIRARWIPTQPVNECYRDDQERRRKRRQLTARSRAEWHKGIFHLFCHIFPPGWIESNFTKISNVLVYLLKKGRITFRAPGMLLDRGVSCNPELKL